MPVDTDELRANAIKLQKSINAGHEKKFPGSGSIIKLGCDIKHDDEDLVSTRNLALDLLLGGGMRWGGLIEFYGTPGCGKTMLASGILAEAQEYGGRIWDKKTGYAERDSSGDIIKSDGIAMAIFAEGINSRDSMELQGVAFDHRLMLIEDFEAGEIGMDTALAVMRHPDFKDRISAMLMDSIAAILPEAERAQAEKNGLSADTVGARGKMMSKFCRQLFSTGLAKHTVVVWINQVQDVIGAMHPTLAQPGGHGHKHAAHIIVRVTAPKGDFIYEGTGEHKRQVGHTVHLYMEKYQAGLKSHPGKHVKYEVYYGKGADFSWTLFDEAVVKQVFTQSSAAYYRFTLPQSILERENLWTSEPDKKTGEVISGEATNINGKEKVVEYLRKSRPLSKALLAQLVGKDDTGILAAYEEAAIEDLA